MTDGGWAARHPARCLAVLAAVTLAARALTFGSPVLHADEPFYLTVADMMRHGAVPYVDVWDRKPVGLFLVYLPAAMLGLPASIYGYQAMAAAAVVGTAWLVMRLAALAGWGAGAFAAAILYVLWLNLGDGQGGQTPVFYNLLVAGAALLVLASDERGERRLGIAAMLLVGLGIQIKYTVVFEGVAFGLWLVAADWRVRRSAGALIGYGAALVAAALFPTALALAVYAAMGRLDAFVFANFVSILHRAGDPPALTRLFLRDSIAILTPLGLALAGWRRRSEVPSQPRAAALLRAWLLVALTAFAGFGGWYNHYTLPVMLPGAVCAAALFARVSRGWAALALALMAIAGQVVLLSERARRGTAAEFATLAAAIGHEPGGLFVYSGPVLLYPATGRAAPTRWLFPSHLEFRREAGSIGVDQRAEVARIFARHPAAVVMAPPIAEEDPAIRARVMRALAAGGYRALPPVRLGHDAIRVWRLPTS